MIPPLAQCNSAYSHYLIPFRFLKVHYSSRFTALCFKSAFQTLHLTVFHTMACERHVNNCKPNLQKRKHRYRTYATCLILCCSSVTRSVMTGSSVIMNCQGSVKISKDVTIFLWWKFIFWSSDLVPEAHCSLPVGESGLKIIISTRMMLYSGNRNALC